MTYSTEQAAWLVGCDVVTAGLIGRCMLGRPPRPLWEHADVRHLRAAIALRADSPERFYTERELARITRAARFDFIHYIVVADRAGIGVRSADRAAVVAANGGAHRILCLDHAYAAIAV